MTAAEFAQLIGAGAVFLGVSALILILHLNRQVRALQRNQRVILGGRGETDLLGHVADLDEQVDNLRMAMEDLAVTAKDHEVRIDGCLARTGLVRFDAYEDLGGRQSTAICFLDQNQNGVVITTVVSREFARMYVKGIRDGQPDVPLAPEEIEAFDQARSQGPAPFTVRPRLEKLRQDRGMEYEAPADAESEPAGQDEEDQEAAARALERENRRRMRRGLPPLDTLPPIPSTQGWGPPLARAVADYAARESSGRATSGRATSEREDEDDFGAPADVSPNQLELSDEAETAPQPHQSQTAPRAGYAWEPESEPQPRAEPTSESETPRAAGRIGGRAEALDDDDTIDFEWEVAPSRRKSRRQAGRDERGPAPSGRQDNRETD